MQHSNPQPMNEKVRIHNPLTSDYYDADASLLVSRELKYISELCGSCLPMDEFRNVETCSTERERTTVFKNMERTLL